MPGLRMFKKGFYSHIGANEPIVAGTINLGNTKGRGSSTRMFNYCTERSANPSLCINQFINLPPAPASTRPPTPPTPSTTILVYNTTQGNSFVWSGVTFTLNTNLPNYSYTAITLSIPGTTIPNSSNLIGATIGNIVTTIGYLAFLNCTGLSSITIPNSVTSIDTGAFAGSGLTSLTFEPISKVTFIGDSVFSGTSLTSVEIPNTVTSISVRAFQNCFNLSSVTFAQPSQLAGINDYAFVSCYSLTSIAIPSSLLTILGGPFFLSGLTNVTIATNPQIISGITFTAGTTVTFFGKTGVNIVYP